MVHVLENPSRIQKVKNFLKRKTTITGIVVLFLVIGNIATLDLLKDRQDLQQRAEGATTSSFLETFTGNPSLPERWNPSNWDIVTNVSDSWAAGSNWDKFNTTLAHHGADCSAPLATHAVTDIYNAVFNCRDHMMTTIEGRGYGVAYLTPNQKVKFTDGEAIISFDVSTFKSSGRQWWDIWVQPFQNNFQLPLESWLPAYNGKPKQAISIKMEGETFNGFYVDNFQQIDLPKTADGWKTVAQVLSERGLQPSATARDKFELRISKNHIKFGMPTYNHWWIDTDIPDKGWSEGTVTLGHHEYNSSKDCTPNPPTDCVATTFHWDNFSISPAVPFTIIKGNEKGVNSTTSNKVTFPSPAPANAFLKFSGVGTIQASYDNGATYKTIAKLPQEKDQAEHFSNYFTPIPKDTTSVLFKGSADRYISQWMVRDPAIYAESASNTPSGETLPTAAVPSVAVTSTPTTTPTITPRPTTLPQLPTVTPTVTPTPLPGGFAAIDFNSGSIGSITGTYPTGVINWGNNKWYHSEPWNLLTTKSVSFNGGNMTTASFDFISPQVLKKLDAYAHTATTVTLSCQGSPTAQINIPAKTLTSINTNWVNACTQVIVTSTNGWDTNFDNFIIASESTSSLTPTVVKTTATPTAKVTNTPSPTVTPIVANIAWKGEYFNNTTLQGTPVLIRNDNNINFNWKGGSPSASVKKDNFSAKWTKTENFDGGTYAFTVSNDDGMIISLDGKVIFNNWKDQPASTKKFNVGIPVGPHTITVVYYENRGDASAKVSWKKL